jgi:hypothetical protein
MKMRLVALILGAALALCTTGTANAAALRILDKDTGYGKASVGAWSRGYHNVGVVARYSGHGHFALVINCANGYSASKSWTDQGPRFRYTRSVPAATRCNYGFAARTNSFVAVMIGVW